MKEWATFYCTPLSVPVSWGSRRGIEQEFLKDNNVQEAKLVEFVLFENIFHEP